MDYLCEVHFNSQVRLQTQGGRSRLWKTVRGMETLLPRGSNRLITGHPVSSRIRLNRLGWRIKCCAPWEGSGWESLLEGEQYVFILYTSSWGSHVFVVILDINLSVFMLIRISSKEAFWFQGLLLRATDITKDSPPSLIHYFQFIIFWKHPDGKECLEVFVGLRNWIYQGNFISLVILHRRETP